MNWLFQVYFRSAGTQHLVLQILLELIRRCLKRVGDPAYKIVIKGKELLLPSSHKLPFYIAKHPFYDTLPGRLSTYLRDKDGYLSMIDVGANIGDTILNCYERHDDCFLAIEADPGFIRYLKHNLRGISNLKIVHAYCSREDGGIQRVSLNAENGTATILANEDGNLVVPKMRLDSIVAENNTALQYNFLKIDTDGGDFDVVAGAGRLIQTVQPVILMECDVFNNRNYIQGFLSTMKIFLEAGYETVIVYDNYGYLYDAFPVGDYLGFKYALFHQLISNFGYYDFLILNASHKSFLKTEEVFFTESMADRWVRHAAKEALDL